MKTSKRIKGFVEIILIVVVLISGVVALFYFVFKDRLSQNETPVNIIRSTLLPEPTPTPFAFQDLTIPYLRNRIYESRLEDMEKVGENVNYTSYIASYSSDRLKINVSLTNSKGEMPAVG